MIDIIVKCNKCKRPIKPLEKFFMVGVQREDGAIKSLAHVCPRCIEDIARALLIDDKEGEQK